MAGRVFPLFELMEKILGYATMHTIVSVGHTNNMGRDYMQDALAKLVRSVLDPYFSREGESLRSESRITMLLTATRVQRPT